MPEFSLVAVAVLVGFAVVFSLLALVGSPDPSKPRCRSCGRDARSCGWRNPCTCDCGADLARSNAVRVGRHRRSRNVVVAITLIGVCIAFAAYDVHRRETGRQWRDLVPASIFGWMLRTDPTSENLESLNSRLIDGMSPSAAEQILAAVAAPSPNQATNIEMLKDVTETIIESIGPLQLDSSVLALHDGGLSFDAIATEVNGETILVPRSERTSWATTTLMRVTSIDAVDHSLTWRALDKNGNQYDGWFPLEGGVTLRIAGTKPGASITVRGDVMIFLANRSLLPLPVDGDDVAIVGPIVLHPESWPTSPTTATFAIVATPYSSAPATSPVPLRREWWPQGRRYGLELDRRVTLGPLFSAAIGAASGVALGFACVWFGFSAGRGWHGLERPRCTRCRNLLRAEGESLPSRCSECGADVTLRGAVLWLRRHRSGWSLALTVPVACVGGIAIGALTGGMAEYATRDAVLQLFRDDAANLLFLMDQWESGNQTQQYEAREAIERTVISERRLFDYATMTTVFDRLRKRLAALDHEPNDYEAQGVAALGVQMINRLVERNFIDRATADAVIRPAIRRAALIVPHLVFESDPIPVAINSYWPNIAVARVSADGVAPMWLTGFGRRESIAAFDTPGVYQVTVEWGEQFVDVYPIALMQSSPPSTEAIAEFFNQAPEQRREVLHIEVTDDIERLAAPVTDPALDPFAAGGARLFVSLTARGGARQIDVGATGPRAALLVGQWTVTIDGTEYPLPVRQPSGGAALLLPDGEFPQSIELRFTPQAPEAPSESTTNSIDRLRFERPRWGVERVLHCERIDSSWLPSPRQMQYRVRQ